MINVRQFCEPFVGVFESGSSQFSGIGDKTLCPGVPDISPTGDLSAKTWQPIFPLTAGPFRSRMCSPQRFFFFCRHGLFFLTYLRVGRGRHVDLAYFRLMGGFYFSGKTGEATALSDVGGCPRASYKIMPQCSWCISGGIVPCCLLGQSRRVGQSQGVRKKEPGEWKKKTCIIVVH